MNRMDDLEVVFINGIYMGDMVDDPINANPMRHRDQENRPKYPIVKFGSEPIDEKRFFFYKSIASKLMQDYDLTNKVWQITVDTHILGLKPPIGISGADDKLETDIYSPGLIFQAGKDAKYTQLPVGNANDGHQLIKMADEQTKESTQDPIRGGVSSPGTQTAFEIARLEQNARIQLGIIGKMIIQAVKDLGNLMIDDIIRHQIVGEVENILGGIPQ